MQELYNALMRGEAIYKDGVAVGQHPPTALSLRAARTLKQLSDINDTNATLINQLQSREQEWLKILEKGYSIDEIIKILEDLPPVVEKSKPIMDTASTVVDKPATYTATATKTEYNMFK